ncbi:MAG: radical SAM protein [Dissulfurimicrobium sp.]|uniref:radical SAM protein n=1 Tax=Dissulfurimicrobium sp. TaxID=2022436 RepID=UPI00404B46D0
MSRSPRYLVLLLTTACNLDCAYCYREDHGPFQRMPREIAENSLHLAASSGRSFHVQLAGGEPTLEPGLIEWVASFVRKKGWPATLGIQTNGTILDTSLTRLFKRYDIQVGVSLDGPPDIHEKLRGNAGSTFRGLKLLSDQEVPFRVTTVVTGQNTAVMGKLMLLLGAFVTAEGLGLDLLVRKGHVLKSDFVSHASPQALRSGLRDLVQALGWINKNRSHPIRLRELESLKQAARRGGAVLFCQALKGKGMAVHPDGTVYPCAQTVGDPHFACGTVESLNESHLDLLKRYSLQGEQCRGCQLSGFCPGDCPSRLYYNDTKTSRLACVMYQTLWEECMKGA